jgi:hypothetical protein
MQRKEPKKPYSNANKRAKRCKQKNLKRPHMQTNEPYATKRALLKETSTAYAAKRALLKTAYATKTALLNQMQTKGLYYRV